MLKGHGKHKGGWTKENLKQEGKMQNTECQYE